MHGKKMKKNKIKNNGFDYALKSVQQEIDTDMRFMSVKLFYKKKCQSPQSPRREN